MITFDEAKSLNRGDALIDNHGKRWRVNGQVKLWKTDPKRIRVPLKHGLYAYDALIESGFNEKGECHWLTRERNPYTAGNDSNESERYMGPN